MIVSVNDAGDHVCEHGRALDMHCCNCHNGFLFDLSQCVCVYRVVESPACPRCQSAADVWCIADASHAEAPRDVWRCFTCNHVFTV